MKRSQSNAYENPPPPPPPEESKLPLAQDLPKPQPESLAPLEPSPKVGEETAAGKSEEKKPELVEEQKDKRAGSDFVVIPQEKKAEKKGQIVLDTRKPKSVPDKAVVCEVTEYCADTEYS